MPSEPTPLCHGNGPEDDRACLTYHNCSSTVPEDSTNAGTSSQLTESTGEIYWGLARHDENYKTLFGDARQALALLPELEDVATSLLPKPTVVADIPSFLQEQIDSGELGFQVDRSGDNLAHLVDQNGRMRHVLRLDTKHLTPELSQAWNNLRTRAMQFEIMRGLRDIEEAVSEVKAGIQDDRLALVDSAWSLIEQAHHVSDSENRKLLLNQALDKAVVGHDQLTRSIDRDLANLKSYKGVLEILRAEVTTAIKSQKSLTEKNADCAEQVVRAIAAIESATRAAALVHMHHGEQDAARTTLRQFQNLLRDRHLDNDAAITTLSSFARKDQKPLLARILSSYTHALEICEVDHKTLLVPSTGDTGVGTPTEDDPADSSVAVPTCDECGREIETGATLCTYHQGKKWEERAGIIVVVVPLAVTAVKHRRPIQQGLGAAAKVIRSL